MSAFIAKVCWPEGFADMDPEAGIVADYKHYLPDLDPAGTLRWRSETNRRAPRV